MKRIDIVDLNSILENTSDLWKDIEEKTIFITGGTGFFGLWLLESFVFINRKLGLNAKLILLTRNKTSFIGKYPFVKNYSEISYIEGDILNFKFPEELSIDYIIHAATEASVKLNVEQPLIMLDTIVNGTRNVLDLAKLKKIKSMLFVSSGAVYGVQPSELTHIDEEYTGSPSTNISSSAYGEGKRVAELLSTIYSNDGLNVKFARCFAFVGPYLPLNGAFALGNFINNFLKNEDILIEGDGTPFRSYLYSSDLSIWLWTILFRGEKNRFYNVGSDEDINIEKLAHIVASLKITSLNVNCKLEKSNQAIQRYVPNISRASKELNLKVIISLKEAILKTINFYT